MNNEKLILNLVRKGIISIISRKYIIGKFIIGDINSLDELDYPLTVFSVKDGTTWTRFDATIKYTSPCDINIQLDYVKDIEDIGLCSTFVELMSK